MGLAMVIHKQNSLCVQAPVILEKKALSLLDGWSVKLFAYSVTAVVELTWGLCDFQQPEIAESDGNTAPTCWC